MARKALIEKELKRKLCVAKYAKKREKLVALVKNPQATFEQKIEAQRAIKAMPRNASATRMRNRCSLTGRSRGYMRMFRLGRMAFRSFALQGLLPGVKKASW